jgi:hypothetical protein
MYIRYNAQSKVIIHKDEKKPSVADTELYKVAEYNGEIPKNDWLTVGNIEPKTRIIKEAYDETIYADENGEPLKEQKVIHHEAVIENYLECMEVTPHFGVYTEQETAKQKQARYESLVEKYIREKYSLSNELAILRQANTKYTEFYEYNAYAEECKARAKTEVYGTV